MSDWDPDEFNQCDLENWIKAAGDYVQPGSEVRPQIIEAVRQRTVRKRAWRPLLRVSSWSLAVLVGVVMIGQALSPWVPQGVTASEIQDRAQQRATSAGIPLDWALTEVVHEWRRSSEADGPRDAVSGNREL